LGGFFASLGITESVIRTSPRLIPRVMATAGRGDYNKAIWLRGLSTAFTTYLSPIAFVSVTLANDDWSGELAKSLKNFPCMPERATEFAPKAKPPLKVLARETEEVAAQNKYDCNRDQGGGLLDLNS
jgi:hypothetical protein